MSNLSWLLLAAPMVAGSIAGLALGLRATHEPDWPEAEPRDRAEAEPGPERT